MDPQTRTGRYVTARSPNGGFDGLTYVPAGTFTDPTFMPRLSWSASPGKVPFDWGDICDNLEAAPAGTTFVCDTSLFDDDTDDRLWAALLNGPRKMLLTPRTKKELDPWFARRANHPVKRAIEAAAETVGVEDYSEWSEAERNSFVRYVTLLA